MKPLIFSFLFLPAFCNSQILSEKSKANIASSTCFTYTAMREYGAEMKHSLTTSADKTLSLQFDRYLKWPIDSNSNIPLEKQKLRVKEEAFIELLPILFETCERLYEDYEIYRAKTLRDIEFQSTQHKIDSLSVLIAKTYDLDLVARRSLCYMGMKKYDKAEEDLKNCMQINKESFWPLFSYAHLYEIKKDYNKALEYYEKLYEMSNETEFLSTTLYLKRKIRISQ